MSKLKKPPATTGRIISERAFQQEAVSADKRPPSFSFEFLRRDYCITKCTEDERLAFVDKMHRMSQLTWSALRQAGRHGLGYEIIDRSSIRTGLPLCITEDVNIIAFRFQGMKAMVGYRSREGVFYVVWFDRDFSVYDHGN